MYNGNIIKQLLAEKKIQNKELLNYLGTEANSSLSHPTVRRLEKVADFFGVSMDVFFNREKPYQTFSTNDLNNLQLFKDKIELLEKLLEEKDKRIALLENLNQALSKK